MKNFILVILFLFFLFQKQNAQPLYINTICGDTVFGYSGDGGMAINAKMSAYDLTFDSYGNLYVCDISNSRVRKIDTLGIITTIAGNGVAGYSGDGGLAINAQLDWPSAVAVDIFGNIYIADIHNYNVRKVSTSGIITTVAGNGIYTYAGDGGLATSASIKNPQGLTTDSFGNLYIVDRDANCIRKINNLGIISTIAGNGTVGYSGDGGLAINAKLYHCYKAKFDQHSNLYIADGANNVIRKIDSTGIITTIAGNGCSGFSGDGGLATSAQLSGPADIAFDLAGNIYIAECWNYRIRKINNTGIINTLAGIGSSGFIGDGGLAINSKFKYAVGISIKSNGIYIADWYRVRKISCNNNSNKSSSNCNTFSTDIKKENEVSEELNIYPNPNTGNFTIELNNNESYKNITITDVTGKIVYNKKIVLENKFSVTGLNSGVYNVTITGNATFNKRIVVLN